MRNFIFLAVAMLTTGLYGQQIQYAAKLIKYSSDLGGKQFGIKRILGKPDVFPQGGYSPNAWTPKMALDGYETVEVGFEKPQSVKQVAVFENLNAGCVVKIGVGTGDGKYRTVWSRQSDYKTPTFKATIPADRDYYFKRKRRKVLEAPDVMNPGIEHAILQSAVPNVVAVKVEFNFALLPGQKQVDAIGISDSDVPLEAEIHDKPALNAIADPSPLNLFQTDVLGVAISQDGKTLYCTGTDDDREQVYRCNRTTDGIWSEPEMEKVLSQNSWYNYVEYVSGRELLLGGHPFDSAKGETGFQWYQKEGNQFFPGDPLRVTAYANYGNTSDAALTVDQQDLILAVESDFTQGGTDLYFARKKDDGVYSFLQNMGKAINSADEEITPQLLSDGRTLLFSSNGFSGYGSFDLYLSYRLDDSWKNWSEPINLGQKINSTGSEWSPFYDETSEMLYFTRYVDGNRRLYSVQIAKADLIGNN